MTNAEAKAILKSNKPTSDPRKCGKELCTAVDIAIEALEKQMHNCEDCRRAYSVPSNPIIYCFEHDCIMRGDNCCRDWSEED